MSTPYIRKLGTRRLPPSIGRKAENLRFLIRHGWQVPLSYVCTWDAYVQHRAGDPELSQRLASELGRTIDTDRPYAVRSSANIEDDPERSFAGQFKSVLNVQGGEEILEAILAIWSAARSPSCQAYLAESDYTSQNLKMAVIIQEMVSPEVSGVAFSKNPISGLDEVVVEAVRGSGEALVQQGVTPYRWINKWGTWTSMPDETDDGQGIDLELIETVVRQTKEIARDYGRPVDLEWVYDGQEIMWVQLREITSLDIPLYSNRISKEVFPGIVKPLIWSINVPLVNGAWVALLTELLGPNDIEPESLAGYFYSRAYFNMGTLGQVFRLMGLPRETLEVLMGIEVEGPERPSFKPSTGTYRLLPRMLLFALDKLRFARKVNAFLPAMGAKLQPFRGEHVAGLDEKQLLDRMDHLYSLTQETAYYTIVTQLLMQVYNRILTAQLARIEVEFERFDLTAGMQELEQFEPNVHLARLHQLYSVQDEGVRARVRDCNYDQLSTLPGAGALERGIAQFLDQFGHLSDRGSDFSQRPWRENPDLVLQMVINYEPPRGSKLDKVRLEDLRKSSLRSPLFKTSYRRARRFRWYREAVSSLYTFSHGLFRDHFLALGDLFVRGGAIARREDIFYLYIAEIRELVETGRPTCEYRALIRDRKVEMEQMRDVTPPETIYGDQAPRLDAKQGTSLKGIPTSRGQYTGPARVLMGLHDMAKLQEGDVLVIPYSEVGWTPLFTKAKAVIAESGGILSHSSIIAREYGIPAVVSVPGACQIADGTQVTVDGYRGAITLHESPEAIAQ